MKQKNWNYPILAILVDKRGGIWFTKVESWTLNIVHKYILLFILSQSEN